MAPRVPSPTTCVTSCRLPKTDCNCTAFQPPAPARHCEAPSASTPSATEGSAATAAAAAAAAGDDAEEEKPLPLAESLACLAAAFAHVGQAPGTMAAAGGGSGGGDDAAAAAVAAAGQPLAAALGAVLAAQLPWQAKLAAANATTAVAQVGPPHRCRAALRQ